jgi:cellulose synthase/poly-beta-1,6-N-acetylglucosamine synthase-like glycosyltransferase
MWTLIEWIWWILMVYIAINVLYIFLFSLFGKWGGRLSYKILPKPKSKMAVFIPGYKEDAVIVDTAQKALEQQYPSSLFRVIIIADSFQEETLQELQKLPIDVVIVSFEKSTKSKALNKTMAQIEEDFDVAVVLDADNVMEKEFLMKVDGAMQSGYSVLQAHRTAKNKDTPMAVLDALSEEINNQIFRKGHQALGLSSALIGSGMAFKYDEFKDWMSRINAISGFDKELELLILSEGRRMYYLDDALVYDEEVSKSEVFDKQRTRWLAAQVHYAKKGILPALKALLGMGNVDFFNKVLQFWMLPRILMLGLLTIAVPIDVWLFQEWTAAGLWVINAFGLVLAIPSELWGPALWKAIWTLPSSFIRMVKAGLNIKEAKDKFLHTPHETTKKDPS